MAEFTLESVPPARASPGDAATGAGALRELIAAGKPGLVFDASAKTFHECILRSLLGARPNSERMHFARLREQGAGGTPLFLMCIKSKELHGVLVNEGDGGLYEPEAWGVFGRGGRTKFTTQVRFRAVARMQPLAEAQMVEGLRHAHFRGAAVHGDAPSGRS